MMLRLLAVLSGGLAAAAAQAPAWERISVPSESAVPTPRHFGLLASWPSNQSLVLFGGVRTVDVDDDEADVAAHIFDIASETWREVQSANEGPSDRFSLVGGVDDASGQLFVFGGQDPGLDVYNDVWTLDLGTGVWSQVLDGSAPGSPGPRYGMAGGLVTVAGEQFLLVSHGFDAGIRLKDSFALRLGDLQWLPVDTSSGDVPTPRCLVAGAALAPPSAPGEALLAMYGGCGSGGYGPCPSSESWVLEIAGLSASATSLAGQWRGPGPTCLHGRNFGAMAADEGVEDGTFFLYGGAGGVLVSQDAPGQLNTLSRAVDNDLWRQTDLGAGLTAASVPGQPASQSAMVAVDGTLYLQLAETSTLWRLTYGSSLADIESVEALACNDDPIPAWRRAHFSLMGLSWGLLLPLGVFIARFGKKHDPLWFHLHRALNITGLLAAFAGVIIAFLMVAAGHFLSRSHAVIGVIVMFLGLMQPLNALCRPHKVDPLTGIVSKGRKIWAFAHKQLGRLALALGLTNIFLGLLFVVSPSSPAFIIFTVWAIFYALVTALWTILRARRESNADLKKNAGQSAAADAGPNASASGMITKH